MSGEAAQFGQLLPARAAAFTDAPQLVIPCIHSRTHCVLSAFVRPLRPRGTDVRSRGRPPARGFSQDFGRGPARYHERMSQTIAITVSNLIFQSRVRAAALELGLDVA